MFGADVLSSRKKLRKTLLRGGRGGRGGGNPPGDQTVVSVSY